MKFSYLILLTFGLHNIYVSGFKSDVSLYCNKSWQRPRQHGCDGHLMCKFKLPCVSPSAESCRKSKLMVFDDKFRQAIVNFHNEFRNAVAGGYMEELPTASNMHPLTYSKELEYFATCATGLDCDDDRKLQKTVRPSYCADSSVIRYQSANNWLTFTDDTLNKFTAGLFRNKVIVAWTKMIHKVTSKLINDSSIIDNPKSSDEEKFIAQLLWAKTLYVGCAIRKSGDVDHKYVIHCFYAPGRFSTGHQIYKIGRCDSVVGSNKQVYNKYAFLCGNGEYVRRDISKHVPSTTTIITEVTPATFDDDEEDRNNSLEQLAQFVLSSSSASSINRGSVFEDIANSSKLQEESASSDDASIEQANSSSPEIEIEESSQPLGTVESAGRPASSSRNETEDILKELAEIEQAISLSIDGETAVSTQSETAQVTKKLRTLKRINKLVSSPAPVTAKHGKEKIRLNAAMESATSETEQTSRFQLRKIKSSTPKSKPKTSQIAVDSNDSDEEEVIEAVDYIPLLRHLARNVDTKMVNMGTVIVELKVRRNPPSVSKTTLKRIKIQQSTKHKGNDVNESAQRSLNSSREKTTTDSELLAGAADFDSVEAERLHDYGLDDDPPTNNNRSYRFHHSRENGCEDFRSSSKFLYLGTIFLLLCF